MAYLPIMSIHDLASISAVKDDEKKEFQLWSPLQTISQITAMMGGCTVQYTCVARY